MSKRVIASVVVIIFLLLLSIWGFWVSYNVTKDMEKTSSVSKNVNSEEIRVEELIITETKKGKKLWEVQAESGHYDNVKNLAVLKTVKGNFFKNSKIVLSFRAPAAFYDQQKKEVRLINGASAITENGVYVNADEMAWQGIEDQILAQGNVSINKSDRFLTLSDKAFFNKDFSSFKINGKSKTSVYQK